MLMRACDARLPARLTLEDCDWLANTLILAAQDVMDAPRAYGT